MTQIGIEYQKLQNERDRTAETKRNNLVREQQARDELAENARWHDLSRQTSLDTAAMAAGATKYSADKHADATRLSAASNIAAAKMGLQRGTLAGAIKAGEDVGWLVQGIDAAGWLWDKLM